MFRSGNPTINDKAFYGHTVPRGAAGDVMTLQGTVNKSGVLLGLVFAVAYYVYTSFLTSMEAYRQGSFAEPSISMGWVWGGAILGFILVLATTFKKHWSPFTVPLYGVCEGLFLGGISAFFEARFPGIVFQAISITFCIFAALLFIYKTRIIKVTDNFRMGVFAATGGIALVYLVNFILRFFGISIPFIHGSGIFGILFSLFVIVIASLNLVMDFDFIENASERGNVPKYMEWYGAMGLMVTLIWLYIEILHLLSKLNRR